MKLDIQKNISYSENHVEFYTEREISKKEFNKLKIRSKNLLKRFESVIQDYDYFLNKVRYELDDIGKEFYDDYFDKFLLEFIEKYDDLIHLSMSCYDLDKLEQTSDLLENAIKYFNNAKQIFFNKLAQINNLKSQRIENETSEYNKLFEEAESLMEIHFKNYGDYKDRINRLLESVDELHRYLDKTDFKINLNVINNDLDNNRHIIWEFEDKLDDIDELPEVFNKINKISPLIEEINAFSFDEIEKRIANQESVYEELSIKSDQLESSNIHILLPKLDDAFNNRMFVRFELRKYNLSDLELEQIKDNIQSDIKNLKITDESGDINSIIKTRCEQYKRSSLNETEFENIINNVDVSNIDETIVSKCKMKTKSDFDNNKFNENEIELRFKNCILRKSREKDNLNKLNEIKNNSNVPFNKKYLTSDELNEIYQITENKICSEYGLKDEVVDFVTYSIKEKIRQNQSEARSIFTILKRDLEGLTNEEMDSFTKEIELRINKYEIKYQDLNDDYLRELATEFKNNGKILL